SHPEDMLLDLQHFQGLATGEIQSYEIEKRYLHRDGRIIWGLLNVSAARGPDGQVRWAIGQIQDITSRKLSEQALQQANALLSRQNQQLDQFARMASHNLRSPLANAIMLLEQIPEDASEQAVRLAQLDRSLRQALLHLEDLAAQLHQPQPLGLERCRSSFSASLQKACQALAPEIHGCQARIEPDFALAELDYVPVYLDSILYNLLSNALKYRHPERRPLIRLSSLLEQGQPVLEISDNGIGIDLDRHGQELFGLYHTFHTHPQARGIGLYLTRNQLESLGGRILAESTPGEGSRFIVCF
ncbi:MAG: ATP-binding protein, partial [Candidatus Sericytochromatia bacterium]